MTTTEKVEDLKNKGNTAFSSGKFQEAVDLFTEAIALDSKNAVLFSNRSAAWASLKEYQGALKDAEEAIILRPDWPKGWGRKGAALAGRGELEGAKQAYERALELEPENGTLKKAIETVERELDRQKSTSTSRTAEGEGSRLVENIFADSTMWERLRADPKMASYLEDPNFVTILNELRSDPKSLTNHIKDPRVMQAFAVMLGVQMKTPEQFQAQERQAATNLRAQQASSPSPAKASPSIEDSNKVEALKEKEQGNEAYKQKNFEAALQHYEHAISLDPNNVALLNNKAAVYFEQGHYDECISQCQQAVEHGREIYADFKLIAKALGRIGSAWEQKGDLDQAISYYHKSLTEHRTPDILAKLKDAERAQEAARKAAYHSPALAETERNAGNELFKQGKYDEALQHYSEAIRRDENDPRAWANRAACYLKLTAVPEGLRDCDRALILDPNFVKAHIRKAALLHLNGIIQKP